MLGISAYVFIFLLVRVGCNCRQQNGTNGTLPFCGLPKFNVMMKFITSIVHNIGSHKYLVLIRLKYALITVSNASSSL